jgi:hypothetical protein
MQGVSLSTTCTMDCRICISLHYGIMMCSVYLYPLSAAWMCSDYCSLPKSVWTCLQGVSLSTASSLDMQGVSLSTRSMNVQGVSLSTASNMDMQGVSLSTICRMYVQNASLCTTSWMCVISTVSSVNVQGCIPFYLRTVCLSWNGRLSSI